MSDNSVSFVDENHLLSVTYDVQTKIITIVLVNLKTNAIIQNKYSECIGKAECGMTMDKIFESVIKASIKKKLFMINDDIVTITMFIENKNGFGSCHIQLFNLSINMNEKFEFLSVDHKYIDKYNSAKNLLNFYCENIKLKTENDELKKIIESSKKNDVEVVSVDTSDIVLDSVADSKEDKEEPQINTEDDVTKSPGINVITYTPIDFIKKENKDEDEKIITIPPPPPSPSNINQDAENIVDAAIIHTKELSKIKEESVDIAERSDDEDGNFDHVTYREEDADIEGEGDGIIVNVDGNEVTQKNNPIKSTFTKENDRLTSENIRLNKLIDEMKTMIR